MAPSRGTVASHSLCILPLDGLLKHCVAVIVPHLLRVSDHVVVISNLPLHYDAIALNPIQVSLIFRFQDLRYKVCGEV